MHFTRINADTATWPPRETLVVGLHTYPNGRRPYNVDWAGSILDELAKLQRGEEMGTRATIASARRVAKTISYGWFWMVVRDPEIETGAYTRITRDRSSWPPPGDYNILDSMQVKNNVHAWPRRYWVLSRDDFFQSVHRFLNDQDPRRIQNGDTCIANGWYWCHLPPEPPLAD